jgi:putative redox protein
MTFSNSAASIIRATFTGSAGVDLSARLDLPAGPVHAFALFAHCFTCSKDLLAARRIAGELASSGIGVLRFDFTGLGSSEGEFANTHFSSNVQDLIAAASYLRNNYAAPAILIGHSLGGAAVLAAAADVPEAKAVVTIGAPADVSHVLGQFGSSLQEIRDKGEAQVTLAGRSFNVSRAFVEDAVGHRLTDRVSKLGKALLVMHAPRDAVVGIDNASRIFLAAKHPKSFVSLDDADHLLSDAGAATHAARVIGAWASKYVPDTPLEPADETVGVLVRETGQGTYQNAIVAGRHRLIADEPVAAGGLDSGPTPYDYLAIALGACTAMTLRVYAKHKKLALGRVSVAVRHGKVAVQHCSDCGAAAEGREGRIDRFERSIAVDGDVDAALREKLIEIADKCPVHRTLEAGSAVVTTVVAGAEMGQALPQSGRR